MYIHIYIYIYIYTSLTLVGALGAFGAFGAFIAIYMFPLHCCSQTQHTLLIYLVCLRACTTLFTCFRLIVVLKFNIHCLFTWCVCVRVQETMLFTCFRLIVD